MIATAGDAVISRTEYGERQTMGPRKRFLWGILPLAGVAAGLCGWFAIGPRGAPHALAVHAVAVSAAKVAVADVPISIEEIGAAQAWQGVVIRTQVNGRLKEVAVQEGSQVKAGELIAAIDPAPYIALLTQAQGAFRRDQAQLELAQLNLKRDVQLAAQDSIAFEAVDTQRAMVQGLEGTVLLDKGAVDSARVNLNYCRITSPITGRVGVRLVDAGNLVATTDSGGIVTINQLTPIAVTFALSEEEYHRLSDASDAFAHPLSTLALNQDTGAPLGTGELIVADNHFDASTGTVQMKARFPNANGKLWPGQFVNVQVTFDVRQHAITIPNSAVNHGPQTTFAYVIGADHKVSVSPITVALVQDATAVIASGLRPGEKVVTDGQMSLKAGSTVIVRNVDSQSADAASPTKPSPPTS
ncbi:MAG TPA: efflux RND transporter periplasmic adaptor subunit [Steroidobacteraceae bacterium]|nr:efflux RND transporter periplasmic adaptor subunit [Steroidobacteraceae bacterium]